VAGFTYGASGLAVTFTDQSVDAFGTIGAWTWDFGDGGTSTLQNPVHAFPTAGTYLVTETVVDGTNAESSAAPKQVTVAPCGTLTSYLHDFKALGEVGGHPDFENSNSGLVTGIASATMTAGGVPAVSANFTAGKGGVTSAESFAQWFTDDPINYPIQQTLALTDNLLGSYTYSNGSYFPIDNEGFGNYQAYMDGLHNFHFTTMLHARFQYNGNETFSVLGDDDIWVYVNGHLAIDLGGVHGALAGSVTLDAAHALLFELTAGQTYKLDFFQAQRHTTISSLSLQTTIQCLSDGH
jgi:fibro-slime domain-containing protein